MRQSGALRPGNCQCARCELFHSAQGDQEVARGAGGGKPYGTCGVGNTLGIDYGAVTGKIEGHMVRRSSSLFRLNGFCIGKLAWDFLRRKFPLPAEYWMP